jgi:hypothetical protein
MMVDAYSGMELYTPTWLNDDYGDGGVVDILAVDAYSGVELCTPTWLNHDYGDGGVVDILAVDAYSEVEVCTPIFLGEASKKILGSKSFSKKFKTQMDTSLNKAQHKQYLALVCR